MLKLEAGEIAELRVGHIERCFAVFDATVRMSAAWRGAGLERLIDEGHASLVGAVVALLQRYGWIVKVEVSFSDYGDRGSIDVLAWHPARLRLTVFEVKSEMGGVDPTLRPLDVKVRLAPKIAQRFGWRTAGPVARVLVLPEDRTARRAVARHSAIFDQALPARGREVRSWLREPNGPLSGVWFLTYVAPGGHKRNPSALQRVRRPKRRTDARTDSAKPGGKAA